MKKFILALILILISVGAVYAQTQELVDQMRLDRETYVREVSAIVKNIELLILDAQAIVSDIEGGFPNVAKTQYLMTKDLPIYNSLPDCDFKTTYAEFIELVASIQGIMLTTNPEEE